MFKKIYEMDAAPEYSVFKEKERLAAYASTGQRLANYIIDLIVGYAAMFAVFFIVGMLSAGFTGMPEDMDRRGGLQTMIRLCTIAVSALIYVLQEGLSGDKTLGKLITRTRAVQEDGHSPLTWGQVFGRSFSRIVPFEVFSGFSGHPWHDKWTNTCVIRDLNSY